MTDSERGDLTLGGPQGFPWSYPSVPPGQASGGMVYMGYLPATKTDYEMLRSWLNESPYHDFDSIEEMAEQILIDEKSVVGLWHPDWSDDWTDYAFPPGEDRWRAMGGEGSDEYMTQFLGKGVQIAREKIWHYNEKGEFVMEIPGLVGEYHAKYLGDGYYDNYVGPEPGSRAAELLGKDQYYLDDRFGGFYGIKRFEDRYRDPADRVNWEQSMVPKADTCPHCGEEL